MALGRARRVIWAGRCGGCLLAEETAARLAQPCLLCRGGADKLGVASECAGVGQDLQDLQDRARRAAGLMGPPAWRADEHHKNEDWLAGTAGTAGHKQRKAVAKLRRKGCHARSMAGPNKGVFIQAIFASTARSPFGSAAAAAAAARNPF